ncbi:unnamed protein product, partial [Phaeothamnion confervicola]
GTSEASVAGYLRSLAHYPRDLPRLCALAAIFVHRQRFEEALEVLCRVDAGAGDAERESAVPCGSGSGSNGCGSNHARGCSGAHKCKCRRSVSSPLPQPLLAPSLEATWRLCIAHVHFLLGNSAAAADAAVAAVAAAASL